MANEMTSFVRIKKANDDVVKRLKEIFTPSEGKYDVSSIELMNRIYGTNYSYEADKEDWNRDTYWPSNEEWEKKLGPKWSYGEESSTWMKGMKRVHLLFVQHGQYHRTC